jgi:hypothetical protein
LTQDELDDGLRIRFLYAIDDAHKYANEQRDIEALGQLAQLIGTCIDWDKGEDGGPVMGFKHTKETENE